MVVWGGVVEAIPTTDGSRVKLPCIVHGLRAVGVGRVLRRFVDEEGSTGLREKHALVLDSDDVCVDSRLDTKSEGRTCLGPSQHKHEVAAVDDPCLAHRVLGVDDAVKCGRCRLHERLHRRPLRIPGLK